MKFSVRAVHLLSHGQLQIVILGLMSPELKNYYKEQVTYLFKSWGKIGEIYHHAILIVWVSKCKK